MSPPTLIRTSWPGRSRPGRARPGRARLAGFALGLILCLPAAADWLITLEGKLIETRGPWTIDGRTLTYLDLEGVEHTFDLDEIDLEGSEETTAIKSGKPYVPKETEAEAPAAEAAPGTEPASAKRAVGKDEEPKIILYTVALCPLCTEARDFLEKLGVDFRVVDITKSKRARKEYMKKAGHGGGLPVVDVDGTMIYTWNPAVVKRKVGEYLERQAAEAESSRP